VIVLGKILCFKYLICRYGANKARVVVRHFFVLYLIVIKVLSDFGLLDDERN